jgi:site-specific recombinase XerD
MNTLGLIVVKFFRNHLTNEKGLSANSIASYSDCLQLFLNFCSTELQVKIDALSLASFSETIVLNFLDYLEKKRGNSAKTRNQRLAVMKCFFRFVAGQQVSFLETCQKVCAISTKKTEHKIIQSLSQSEVKAILEVPDRNTARGARDHLLLLLLYNTGARVQELCDLKIGDINMKKPLQVQLTGKGKKQRITPLWEKTTEAVKHYLSFRENSGAQEHLFLNARGGGITRFGVTYIIKKYVKKAAAECSTLNDKNISPHTFRHTTALHLIQAGVDILTVKEWLGHKDIKTTMDYLEIGMEMKRQALELCPASFLGTTKAEAEWTKPSVLRFLQDLSKRYVQ